MGKAEGEGFTAISTNIGTYNDENHVKLHDELTEIEGKHGEIKFTLLQELNRSDRKFNDQALPPFYNEQPTTNQHKNEDNELRGVGIFGSTGNEEIEARIQSNLDSLHNEFLIKVANSSYSTTSGRKKETQVALIDCYGNHAKKAVSDIETELTLAAEFFKNNQVNNIVLIGDLNTEKVELEGFWELRHPDLYHKDKVGARKTYTDKILVNFNGVKIEEVRKSLESKSSTNKSLGHKVIVFSVNKVAPCYTVTSLNYGRFNQIYNERLTELKNIEFGWNKIETARQNDNTIFVIGNGGSASTASHIGNDFGLAVLKTTNKSENKSYRVLSLVDNISVISAIGNDSSFNNIFLDQLKYIYCISIHH